MTTTAPVLDREDVTVDQRRAVLIELAEHVHVEDTMGGGPFSPCVDLLISELVSRQVRFAGAARTLFDDLVGAVAEKSKFNADPRGYADLVDLEPPVTEAQLDALDERLQSNLDYAADRLVGAR